MHCLHSTYRVRHNKELDRMTKLIDVLTNLKMFLSIHKFHKLKRLTLAILRANLVIYSKIESISLSH